MASKITKVIFILLAAGVVLYVVKSGVVGNSIDSLSQNGSSSNSGGGFFSFLHLGLGTTTPQPSEPDTTYLNPQAGTGAGNNIAPAINPADIPAGFTADQLSPFFHQVRFGGISYGSYGSYGEITLYAEFQSASTTIDVTGWQIKAENGGEYIPQAINVYDPSGLTVPNDIILHQSDDVYLYSSRGPFNLRLNECIGYIAKDNMTTPEIPQDCPYINQSQLPYFTGACQNYIESIGNCQTPDLNNPQIPINDYACRDYIANNFTYASCFNAHVNDPNFLSNEIWIWTGANVTDQYHDRVELLDRNGLLVDLDTY